MLAGIWMFGSNSYPASSANVHIHHNRIYDTGTLSMGGIFSNGFKGLIENNVIDGAYGAGIIQGRTGKLHRANRKLTPEAANEAD